MGGCEHRKSVPLLGGWLCVEVLSVVDLSTMGILDSIPRALIKTLALLGIYLLGKLTFPTIVEHVSIPRLAIFSFAFAIYLVPGLWGAPLKAISAFSPPMYTQDFSLYDGEVRPKYTDSESGMAYAKQVGKPALLDFAGYGCVNCRKMEASVWTDPRVKTHYRQRIRFNRCS